MEMNYTASLFPPFISPSLTNSAVTTMADDYHHHHQALTGLIAEEEEEAPRGSSDLDDDHHHRRNEVSFAGNKREGDDRSEVEKTEMAVGVGNKMKKGDKSDKKKTKKPKYAFQTRSQVDILDDGYRWRKYGQKAVKNNKFPRSYYRCTYQGCNVKKQVQRLTKDEGVVVTTYEGMHSHPIEKSMDNFEHILNQMHIYASV